MYLRIPLKIAANSNIGCFSKIVYGYLFVYYKRNKPYPSISEISKELNKSIRSISSAISDLKRNGIIKVIRKGNSNEYVFNSAGGRNLHVEDNCYNNDSKHNDDISSESEDNSSFRKSPTSDKSKTGMLHDNGYKKQYSENAKRHKDLNSAIVALKMHFINGVTGIILNDALFKYGLEYVTWAIKEAYYSESGSLSKLEKLFSERSNDFTSTWK